MASVPSPRFGTLSLRSGWAGRWRQLAVLLVALVAVATVAHHLTPEHSSIREIAAAHGDHSLPAAAACLGVIDGALLLVAVGGVVRMVRRVQRRPLRCKLDVVRPLPAPPVPPPRSGPPLFMRIGVLRY